MNYQGSIYRAHCETTGSFISGEVKLAITIRMLAGGNCMNLGVMFNISSGHYKIIMYEVLKEWIYNSNIGDIDINAYLNDEKSLEQESKGFGLQSNGVLWGVIGSID